MDPKGLRNVRPEDPKIGFHTRVKDIERRLGDPNMTLDSFIVSNTSSADLQEQWTIDKAELEKRHILFQDDEDSYIGQMLQGITGAGQEPSLA